MHERNINLLPLTPPQPGTWPTTQPQALTGNRISDLLVHRPMAQPTEAHQPGLGEINFDNVFYLTQYI